MSQLNMSLEQQLSHYIRIQEEQALSQIPSIVMQRDEAERIVYISEELDSLFQRDLMSVDEYGYRYEVLQRARFNIPVRLLYHWPILHLATHAQVLLDDTVFRRNQLRQAHAELAEIAHTLTLEQHQARTEQFAITDLQIHRDFGMYQNLIALINRRTDEERIRLRQNEARDRRPAAIARLLEDVEIEDLSIDETDQRCNICYGAYSEGEEKPVKLPCGHVYGSLCIANWLMDQDTCCTCRHSYRAELSSDLWVFVMGPEEEDDASSNEEDDNSSSEEEMDEDLPDYEDVDDQDGGVSPPDQAISDESMTPPDEEIADQEGEEEYDMFAPNDGHDDRWDP